MVDRILTPREVICEGDDELARAHFFPALIEEPPLPAGMAGRWGGGALSLVGGGEGYGYEQFVEFILGEVEKELARDHM